MICNLIFCLILAKFLSDECTNKITLRPLCIHKFQSDKIYCRVSFFKAKQKLSLLHMPSISHLISLQHLISLLPFLGQTSHERCQHSLHFFPSHSIIPVTPIVCLSLSTKSLTMITSNPYAAKSNGHIPVILPNLEITLN